MRRRCAAASSPAVGARVSPATSTTSPSRSRRRSAASSSPSAVTSVTRWPSRGEQRRDEAGAAGAARDPGRRRRRARAHPATAARPRPRGRRRAAGRRPPWIARLIGSPRCGRGRAASKTPAERRGWRRGAPPARSRRGPASRPRRPRRRPAGWGRGRSAPTRVMPRPRAASAAREQVAARAGGGQQQEHVAGAAVGADLPGEHLLEAVVVADRGERGRVAVQADRAERAAGRRRSGRRARR